VKQRPPPLPPPSPDAQGANSEVATLKLDVASNHAALLEILKGLPSAIKLVKFTALTAAFYGVFSIASALKRRKF